MLPAMQRNLQYKHDNAEFTNKMDVAELGVCDHRTTQNQYIPCRISRNIMILRHTGGPKHRSCRIFCKEITQNLVPGCPELCGICRIFNIFAICCLYVTEFAENCVNCRKCCRNSVFRRKCQKINWNCPKDNME